MAAGGDRVGADAPAVGRAARVARNAAFLSAAQLGARVFSVVYFWLVATRLGPAGFGTYQLLLNLMSVFVPIADGGLATATARDAARNPDVGSRHRRTGLLLVATGATAAYALMVATAIVLDIAPDLTALAGLALFPMNAILFVSSLFNARERMETTALLQVAPLALMMALGTLALLAGFGLGGIVVAYVVAHALAGGLAVAAQRFLPAATPVPLTQAWREMGGRWRAALPFGLQALCQQLYVRIDLLLLKDAVPDADLGAYAAAMRLLEAPLLLPALLTTALVPLAATLHASSRETLRDVFERQSRLLGVLGVAAAAGLALLAPDVMGLFGREYAASGPLLRVMALAMAFAYASLPITLVVTTAESQRVVTVLSFVSVGLAAVAYAVGIALNGATGAAWAKVAATASSIVLFYPLVRRLVGDTRAPADAAKAVLAGVASYAVVWLVTGNDLVAALAGSPLYLAAVAALRVFDARDRDLIRRLVLRR